MAMGLPVFALAAGSGCSADEDSGSDTTSTVAELSACEDRLIAYFEPSATPSELDAIEAAVRGVDHVAEVEYFDQAETFAEMQDLFSDASPDLLENVDPEDLPSSFSVRVSAVEALDEVEQLVEAEPAFREVVRADEIVTRAMEASMSDAELEQFCSGDD